MIQPQLFGVLLVLFTIFWQTALIALYPSVYNRHISSWSQQDLADHQAPDLSSPYEYWTNDSYYFSRSTSQHVHFGSCDSSRLVWLQMKSELFLLPPLHLFLPKNGPSDSSALASVGFPLPRNFCQPGGDTVNSMGILLPRIFCLPSRDIVNSVGFPLPGNSPGHCQFFGVFVTKKFLPTQREHCQFSGVSFTRNFLPTWRGHH